MKKKLELETFRICRSWVRYQCLVFFYFCNIDICGINDNFNFAKKHKKMVNFKK